MTDGYFEREVRLDRSATATFLRELADQIDAGNELNISSDEWEIPFQYDDPVEIEVEFIGEHERELEIELEFEWADTGDQLNVK